MQLFINSARFGRVFTACLCLVALGFAPMRTLAQIAQKTFNFTGAVQTFTIPAGVSSLTVVANGAQADGNHGGNGGRVTAVLIVQPNYEPLRIYVGGKNGYNGGGKGGEGLGAANPGGGATDIRYGGTTLADRALVAGGGGATGDAFMSTGQGGAGGNTTGAAGITHDNAGGGGGGGTNAGGAGGNGRGDGKPGSVGIGGNGGHVFGGGGGGGYFGGGGGGSNPQPNLGGGGGGGSSYVRTGALVFGTSVVHVQGEQTGDGDLTLSWQPNPLGASTNLRLATGPGNTYNPTNTPLVWTVNSTDQDYFLLERGKRTSATQVYTDDSLVWTAVSPNPSSGYYVDNSFTGLTANQFGYFYRVKAVSNRLGSSAYAYLIPD